MGVMAFIIVNYIHIFSYVSVFSMLFTYIVYRLCNIHWLANTVGLGDSRVGHISAGHKLLFGGENKSFNCLQK